MDEIHFAPPKNPWNVDSPANMNEQWCLMVAQVVRIGLRPSTVRAPTMAPALLPMEVAFPCEYQGA